MKLTKEQESLLKFVPSVEVRKKIRGYMKNLIKDIKKAEKVMTKLGLKKRFLQIKKEKSKEFQSVVWKLMVNKHKREREGISN